MVSIAKTQNHVPVSSGAAPALPASRVSSALPSTPLSNPQQILQEAGRDFSTRFHASLGSALERGMRLPSDLLHSAMARGVQFFSGLPAFPSLSTRMDLSGLACPLRVSPRQWVSHYHVVGTLPQPFRDSMWRSLVANLQSRGVILPERGMESYDTFIQTLHDHGIHFDERISSLENAVTLLHNQTHLSELGRDRPIALVFANSNDPNGAFGISPCIDQLVGSDQFDVVYVEGDSDADLMDAARRIHEATGGRTIHTLMIAGHGSRSGIMLGDPSRGEEAILDTHDLFENRFTALENLIDPNGQVVLWACNTGAPGSRVSAEEARSSSFADSFATRLPGRRVHATTIYNNIFNLSVDENREVHITLVNDAPYVVEADERRKVNLIVGEDSGILPSLVGEVSEAVNVWWYELNQPHS
ncbi:MAG: hypothetical protein JNK65_05970 [Deltaproteobacteria bacterium]|nr:hypothetical protein [Deltaproteobacteria bacterium]